MKGSLATSHFEIYFLWDLSNSLSIPCSHPTPILMHDSLTSKIHKLLSVSTNSKIVGDGSAGSLPTEKDFGEVD